MKKLQIIYGVLVCALASCSDEAPTPMSGSESSMSSVPGTSWESIQEARQADRQAYIQGKQEAFDWFADFPFGRDDVPESPCTATSEAQCGVPYILFKLLPELDPDSWGSGDNFLDVVGLFEDERLPGYPVPRGIGWTGMAREENALDSQADHASFTCAACHVGRVRLENDDYHYIDGGINTEFNIVSYRVKVFNTIQRLLGVQDPQQILGLLAQAQGGQSVPQLESAVQTVLAALDEVSANNRNYFYNDYEGYGRQFDADYEATQIELFKAGAPGYIGKFIGFATIEYMAFGSLVQANYQGFEQGALAGQGGMADATGISTSLPAMLYQLDSQKYAMFASSKLPPTPGITDFMAPWEQSKRRSRWNADQTELIDGGGQYNGNIPIPMFRTLAAELVMGYGANTDLRISAYARDLLEGLSAEIYPFTVDMDLAARGEVLYEQNCASCHYDNNGTVYKNLGTDMGRAMVVDAEGTEVGRAGLTAFCSPTTTVVLANGESLTPCAEFEGVSLAGENAKFSFGDAASHEGYQALPLGGVWALAPYLHNGSVPTIYHLLVPGERPDSFVKGRLDYDQELLGFSWDGFNSARPEEGYLFDTTAFSALSKQGHDTDINTDGETWKLDWSDDIDGAMAIIEYMKTL